jgi:hypothetical protein
MFSKRDILAGAAAAAIPAIARASSPPAIGSEADPIFAAIEAHREAMKAWDGALKAWYRLEETLRFQKPKPGIAEAEEHANALDDRESDAAAELVATTPTTLAGALAVLRYVMGYYDGESETFPGQSHDLLDDEAFLSFVDGIGDAIEDAIEGLALP